MRGVTFLGNRQAEIREFPDPHAGPGEAGQDLGVRSLRHGPSPLSGLGAGGHDHWSRALRRYRGIGMFPSPP